MKISELMLPEFDQEMANTRKMLAAIPENIPDYKPHPKSMALGYLAGHLAQLPSWGKTAAETEVLEMKMGEFKPFIPKTRQEALEQFDKNVKEARPAIARVSDEDMAKTWTFKMDGHTIFALPRSQVLRGSVFSHIIHHRAQLGVYLRLLDIAIPGMYGPSNDEMGAFTAAK
jgi:uncharacterized damage-inducible protein DinB